MNAYLYLSFDAQLSPANLLSRTQYGRKHSHHLSQLYAGAKWRTAPCCTNESLSRQVRSNVWNKKILTFVLLRLPRPKRLHPAWYGGNVHIAVLQTPTNRATGAKFNFTILYVLASIFGVAIVFLLIEMGFFFHWKRKTKKISRRCPDRQIFQRRGDGYMCTGEQHTLSIDQYNAIPPGAKLSALDYTALGNALAPGKPRRVKAGGTLRGILSCCRP